jgi:hypothetical protein
MFGVDAKLCGVFVSLRFFCVIWIGQSRVAFQSAHCIVSLKNLTAASIFSSVLRGRLKLVSR